MKVQNYNDQLLGSWNTWVYQLLTEHVKSVHINQRRSFYLWYETIEDSITKRQDLFLERIKKAHKFNVVGKRSRFYTRIVATIDGFEP